MRSLPALLHQRDSLGNSGRRHVGRTHEGDRCRRGRAHGDEVLQGFVAQIPVGVGVDDHGRPDGLQQHAAIGGRVLRILDGQHATGPRLVFHDDAGLQIRSQHLRHRACNPVTRCARRKADQQPHRAGTAVLRQRSERMGEHQGAQHSERSTTMVHWFTFGATRWHEPRVSPRQVPRTGRLGCISRRHRLLTVQTQHVCKRVQLVRRGRLWLGKVRA
jgi:hypothetical protein